ncbi:EF-hand domain [Sergentomyia squamirostris]
MVLECPQMNCASPCFSPNVSHCHARDLPCCPLSVLRSRPKYCGVFEGIGDDSTSPFGYRKGEGIDAGSGELDWICNRDRPRTDGIFERLGPIDGKISGASAKVELLKSKLPNNVLSKIWKLSDVDTDGFLDIEEFALAMHLINVKLDGNELPTVLPDHLVPPSKRTTSYDNGE